MRQFTLVERKLENRSVGSVSPFYVRKLGFSLFAFICLISFGYFFYDSLYPRLKNKITPWTEPVVSIFSETIHSFNVALEKFHFPLASPYATQSSNAETEKLQHLARHLKAENMALREMLNTIPEPEIEFVTSRILVRAPQGLYQNLITLQGGKEKGFKIGQLVLDKKAVIGRIISVSDHTSEALLLNDLQSKIPVFIEPLGAKAIMVGTNHRYLKLMYIADDAKINVGDKVLTSADAEFVPQGYLIGKIVSIQNNTILVETQGRLDKALEFVHILTNTMTNSK
jgi:rod shape-determining protein MreC